MFKQQIQITSPRIIRFLDAKGRNSTKTSAAFKSGLELLKRMLSKRYPDYDYDSIIDACLSKTIDVYEVLDSFVSYALTENVTAKTIHLYMSAIKSYFG